MHYQVTYQAERRVAQAAQEIILSSPHKIRAAGAAVAQCQMVEVVRGVAEDATAPSDRLAATAITITQMTMVRMAMAMAMTMRRRRRRGRAATFSRAVDRSETECDPSTIGRLP